MRFKSAQVTAIAVGGIAFAGAVVGALVPSLYTYISRNRELDIEYVKIAASILREKPEKETEPVRSWAISIISRFSPTEFKAVTENKLKEHPLGYRPGGEYGYSWDVVPRAPDAIPIHLVKSALAYLGIYKGPINDENDAAFQQGLKDFQKSKSLPTDGTLNPSTVRALQIAAPTYLGRRLRSWQLEW